MTDDFTGKIAESNLKQLGIKYKVLRTKPVRKPEPVEQYTSIWQGIKTFLNKIYTRNRSK